MASPIALLPGQASLYGFASSLSGSVPQTGFRFGYIYGVFSVNGFIIGDTVLYKESDIITTTVYSSVPYDVVYESQLIGRDTPPIP
jgi:hypothetical protein